MCICLQIGNEKTTQIKNYGQKIHTDTSQKKKYTMALKAHEKGNRI